MSKLHDFSDPATLEEDSKYWYDFYQHNPIGAKHAHTQLLHAKITERYGSSLQGEKLSLKVFWRMQEVNAARSPEERMTIIAQHLQEDVDNISAAWKELADVVHK